jgi:hypothetical protein
MRREMKKDPVPLESMGSEFLWLLNFGSNKSDLNLSANSMKVFLHKP